MSKKFNSLTIATFNLGKLDEYMHLLEGLPIELRTLTDFGGVAEIDENGATFAENAQIKAAGYAIQTGTMTLADDSGLEIAAIDGRPGVFSARYVGEETSFDEKMAFVLAEIVDSGSTTRRARFVCEIAIADNDGSILHTAEGICSGQIAELPRGIGGFGYDPIFIPDGYDETFGELSGSIKHEISHRAQAFAQIIPYLRDLRDNTAVRLDRTLFRP